MTTRAYLGHGLMIALRSVALNADCPIALGRAVGAVTGITGLVGNTLMERRKLS